MSTAAPRRSPPREKLSRIERRALRGADPVPFRGLLKLLPVIRALAWLALLPASFSYVVWRQTQAAEEERELARVRSERAVIEGERVEATGEIEALRSRARIVRVARERLGLHLPRDEEIVLLPVAADAPEPEAER